MAEKPIYEESTSPENNDEEDDDDDTLSLCHFSKIDDTCTNDSLVLIQSPRSSFEFEFINPKKTDVIFRNSDFLFSKPDLDCSEMVVSDRSDSIRFMRSLKDYSVVCSQDVHHKVNITSLTTMSSKSRRRMFMFGPVKFKPEMELSAIKERQNQNRACAVFLPSAKGGETVVTSGGGGGSSGTVSRRKRKQWKLIETLKGGACFSKCLVGGS